MRGKKQKAEMVKAEMKRAAVLDALYPRAIEEFGRRGQVLQGMWDGKCTKEIAVELGVSPKTVEYHREALYRVFKVHNPVSLCRRALVAGVLGLEGKQ